jgi:methionyl-tRNA formyltransferase
MRVVFFGTPDFAVPSLDALLGHGIEVAAVVTQPDRARGRSHSTLVPPPVKVRAVAAGLPVLQPERPRGDLFLHELRALQADLGVVVAYGHLLPPALLEIPRLGFVNVHASLLPRWRGAAPIQWAMLAGDIETGVSIMRVEAGLDSGGVWRTEPAPIGDDDTTGTLTDRLAGLGAALLLRALPAIGQGHEPIPQDERLVTLAPKVDRGTAMIRWDDPAAAVSRRIRAMDPAPGAWTTVGAETIKLFGARVVSGLTDIAAARPGDFVAAPAGGLIVVAGDAADGVAVGIREVQPAGRRRMPAAAWLHGHGGSRRFQ